MTFLRSFCAVAFIACAFGSMFGQVITKSAALEQGLQSPEISSFTVESGKPHDERFSEKLETKITYAIEDELVLNGILPALRTRPAGLIVSFYLAPRRDPSGNSDAALPNDASLVVECRDSQTDGVIWRGIASVVTGLRDPDPYRWESNLTHAARMLVRRFIEEVPTT